MTRAEYQELVRLLSMVLPNVAREKRFALKGGSAINYFHRDFPRLSVDIDLTWLPIASRVESLAEIDASLKRMATSIKAEHRETSVKLDVSGGLATRLRVYVGDVDIKIETSPVQRGVVHEIQTRMASSAAKDVFGETEIQVVSFEEMYAGKLNAALDRQHPRDLFDVKLLYEHEGLTEELFRTFLVYLAGSPRPPHEILKPNPVDIKERFAKDFEGMQLTPVSETELLSVRERLFEDIQSRLDHPAKRFMLGLHDGKPDFDAIGRPQAAKLPAVKWKIMNLMKLKEQNPRKHARQRDDLVQAMDASRDNSLDPQTSPSPEF